MIETTKETGQPPMSDFPIANCKQFRMCLHCGALPSDIPETGTKWSLCPSNELSTIGVSLPPVVHYQSEDYSDT